MSSLALFRLPYADTCTLMVQEQGEPQQLSHLSSLDGEEGYVFAPFAPAADLPILLIHPDRTDVMPCRGLSSVLRDKGFWVELPSYPCPASRPIHHATNLRERYHLDFSNFHAQLVEGSFQKLVLSRCREVKRTAADTPLSLFEQACERYPRMMISLVSTPQGGTWLTATPEMLLERTGHTFKTVALAGTMPFTDDVRWSEKNIREQRYVATYMMETLEHFAHHIEEEGPVTVRAAQLAHLRSDFTFSLPNGSRLGSLVQALHPTPAVCGLPKRDTFQFIVRNESVPRLYYSGFQGPISPVAETHLYVSLRCMMMAEDRCLLYAGGGLLTDSEEENEWQETEAKMRTMLDLLSVKEED